MSRSPTPHIGRPTPLQPAAAPVNTYVRPAEPAPSPLNELAQGLAAFDSKLGDWMQKRDAKQEKADAVRGEATFNRNNQSGWAEGVASGAVPANASPVFMEAYKKAQGSRMGVQMREQFNLEYAQWEGRNSDDPEVFQTFLSDFVTRHITTDDADVLAGLNPHVSALAESASNTYSTDRANSVYRGHLDTRSGLIGDIIDHASQQGLALETGTDYQSVKADILEQRQEALSSGLRMADFDAQLVAAIAAKAIEHGDPDLLELLEETLPGYEVKLSSLPDFRDVKATTEAALVAEYRRRTEADAKGQQAADKAREGAIVTGVLRSLTTDPTADISDEVIREWERYDPEARKKLVDARKSLTDGLTMEDPQDLLTIERMVQSGATVDDIFDLAANGVIRDPSTFKSLVDRVQQRQEAGTAVLSTQTAKRYLTTIKERTAPPFGDSLLAPDGLTDEGIEATREFEGMLIEWVLGHPEATSFEREEFTNRAAELILKRIDRTDPEKPQYRSQADLEQSAAEEKAAQRSALEDFTSLAHDLPVSGAPPLTPNAPQGSSDLNSAAALGRYVGSRATPPEYREMTVDTYGADVPPALADMDQTSSQIIEQQAEAQGVTPEEYNLELWRTMREDLGLSTEYQAPPPLPSPDVSNLPAAKSPQAESQALSYFQSNPEAMHLDPASIRDRTATTSSNWNFGKLSEPSALVIHHTGGRGSVDGVIQTFKDRNFPAHFVIDRDGTISRILADDQKGQHTKPAQDGSGITNDNSWGVEIIAKDDSDLTPEQVQASVQLTNYLHDTYQMPLDRVVGHGQINDHKQSTEGATVLSTLASLGAAGGGRDDLSASSGPSRPVDNLLSFISNEEGTRQDYNITHGYGKYTNGGVRLTSMSVNDVLALQGEMKGRGSSGAVGKYQVLPGTLQDAMQALRLDGSEPFDAQTQDAVAMWLLSRRGLQDWQGGRMDTATFVDNLSKEWASLSGSNGRANYRGQGANASLPKLLAALGQ